MADAETEPEPEPEAATVAITEEPTENLDAVSKRIYLQQVPMFQQLENGHSESLDALAEVLVPRVYSAKVPIVSKDEIGTFEMYFIVSGSVQVLAELDGAPLAEQGPGSFFGEGCLITLQPRSAHVITTSRTHVLVLTKRALFETFERFPDVEEKVMSVLRSKQTATQRDAAKRALRAEAKQHAAVHTRLSQSELQLKWRKTVIGGCFRCAQPPRSWKQQHVRLSATRAAQAYYTLLKDGASTGDLLTAAPTANAAADIANKVQVAANAAQKAATKASARQAAAVAAAAHAEAEAEAAAARAKDAAATAAVSEAAAAADKQLQQLASQADVALALDPDPAFPTLETLLEARTELAGRLRGNVAGPPSVATVARQMLANVEDAIDNKLVEHGLVRVGSGTVIDTWSETQSMRTSDFEGSDLGNAEFITKPVYDSPGSVASHSQSWPVCDSLDSSAVDTDFDATGRQRAILALERRAARLQARCANLPGSAIGMRASDRGALAGDRN
jgi:CRP-like cAMP-binding protein